MHSLDFCKNSYIISGCNEIFGQSCMKVMKTDSSNSSVKNKKCGKSKISILPSNLDFPVSQMNL